MDYHASIRHDIVPLVPQCDSLLDVGGGTGATAKHLKAIGRADKVSVMDAVVADHANGLASWSDANLDDAPAVEAYLSDAGPFDTILLLDVLEHLIDPWSAVDNFAKALKPGGVIIASIPNIRHISTSGALLFRNRWEYKDAGLLDRTHLRFFVRKTAVDLMNRDGLTIETVQPAPIGSGKHRLANALTFGAFRSLFTLQYFITARKSD